MSRKRKQRQMNHCACVIGRELRCSDCGHKLIGQWPQHLEAQLGNLHAVVRQRNELARLLELRPVEPPG